MKANFAIKLHKKDIAILEDIKFSLGVGKIYISGNSVYYRVESWNELQPIIEHFDHYMLVTAKKVDYILFKECFHIIKANEHLTEKGLLDVVKIKSSLNKGLSTDLESKFKVVKTERPEFKFEGIPDPFWVSGFTSGDGSFNIKTTTTPKNKIQLRYAVTLHNREVDVIKGLAEYILFFLYKKKRVNV